MFNTISFWSLVLNILVLIVSISGFVKIMKNDLAHLERDVKDIKMVIDKIDDKLNKNSEEIAAIKATCKANHGV